MQLGYGLKRDIALFVDGAREVVGSSGNYELGHFGLGARYTHIDTTKPALPFLEASVTRQVGAKRTVTLVDDDGGVHSGDVDFSGLGFTIGAGINYFYNPRWALRAAISWTMATFGTVKFNSNTVSGLETDVRTTRLSLGFSWFPGG